LEVAELRFDSPSHQTMTKSPSLRRSIIVIAVVFWLGGVVVAYYAVHKPFNLANAVAVLRGGLGVGVWLALSLLGAGLGRLLLPWLSTERPLERLVLTTGLGLGLVAQAVIFLGLAGALWRPLIWGLLALAAIVPPSRRAMADTWRDLWQLARFGPEAGLIRFLRLYIGLTLALTFLLALTPDVAWDSLVYHLTGPKLYAQWGRIAHSIDLPYLGFPQLMEMLYLAAGRLVSDTAAPLLHFGFGLLSLGLTAALAGYRFNRQVAWLAPAVLLSAETIVLEMSWAYVDLALIFYSTAAFYAFLRWGEETRREWLVLSAVMTGLAMATKYTAIFVPLAVGAALLWRTRRAGTGQLVRRVGWFASLALLLVAPGLIENWITTGNPVYPFALPGVFWDEWRAWWFSRAGTALASSQPWRLVLAPLEATIFGIEGASDYSFALGPIRIEGVAYGATLGPLFLMGTTLWLFLWRYTSARERHDLKQMFWFAGVAYAFWLFGVGQSALLVQSRLILPIFGLLAVIAAAALDRLRVLNLPNLDLSWVANGIVLLVLGLSLAGTGLRFVRSNPLPYLLGFQGKADYYQNRLGSHAEMMARLNATLGPGDRVIFLWEPRSYLCQVDCWPDALLDRFLHLTALYPDAPAIARSWRQAGLSHVLLYQQGLAAILEAGFDPVTPRDLAILRTLQATELHEIDRLGQDYVLYELK
jgi:hypothetical protein